MDFSYRDSCVLANAAIRGELGKTQALRLCKDNPEVRTLALPAAGRRIAELESKGGNGKVSLSTPSGMVPIYTKPDASKGRKKTLDARKGHQGVRRERPVKVDERKTHRLACCPHCRGGLHHRYRRAV